MKRQQLCIWRVEGRRKPRNVAPVMASAVERRAREGVRVVREEHRPNALVRGPDKAQCELIGVAADVGLEHAFGAVVGGIAEQLVLFLKHKASGSEVTYDLPLIDAMETIGHSDIAAFNSGVINDD
jgi:hypothetical protein